MAMYRCTGGDNKIIEQNGNSSTDITIDRNDYKFLYLFAGIYYHNNGASASSSCSVTCNNPNTVISEVKSAIIGGDYDNDEGARRVSCRVVSKVYKLEKLEKGDVLSIRISSGAGGEYGSHSDGTTQYVLMN